MLEQVKNFLGNHEILSLFFWVILGMLAGLVVFLVLITLFKRAIKSLYPTLYGKITIKLRKPLLMLCLVTGALIPFILIPNENILMRVSQKILITLLIVSTAWLLIKGIHVIRLFLMSKYEIGGEDNLKARKLFTQYEILERIMVFVIIFIALGISLMTFEPIRQIGMSLLTSAGVSALIIGLAAQRIIAAFLAGIQLAITQPIRIDDVVVVEGEWGRIEEINLTFVVVKIWDKRRLVLPTTYFIETPFQNWTMTSAEILGTVYIYTDYKFPVKDLREILGTFLKESPKWDGEVNVLQVTGAGEKTMELRVLMSARNASDAWDLRVFMREKILTYLQEKYPEHLPRTRIEIEREIDRNKKENKKSG
ncbi:MAG: mechanosensitive ion channel [Cyclobacteriaceae bacterium]|nr:mechanosensitive ion channel [Cyclobacteriaceae bacterium]